jgi:hypothetical protein
MAKPLLSAIWNPDFADCRNEATALPHFQYNANIE